MSWFGDFTKNKKEIARLKKENDKLHNELERMKVMYAKLRDKHDDMKKAIELAITD